MTVMLNWTDPGLITLSRLYLQNQHSFVVRRYVQRFQAGELTAQEAVAQIRRHPEVLDEDPFPDSRPDV